MDRRRFLTTGAAGGAAALTAVSGCAPTGPDGRSDPDAGGRGAPGAQSTVPPFELDEISVAELQAGMEEGRWTARRLVELYLGRIDDVDRSGPTLRSVLETNPDALAIAEALDRERAEGRVRGPLHGVPVLVKGNVDTADRMTTTAGSLALEGSVPPRDAFVAERLRQAGAIVLGKANLSEWANFRSTRSVSGWSGLGGQCGNPYALDRNPCGSSSGSGAAVSANLCAVAVGTETDGSVVCPSHANGVVGIKPTVGLVSRSGIIPISHTQDTAGPMARTVTDAAILLGAMTGVDPTDEATAASADRGRTEYTDALARDGLQGARIGVARNYGGFAPRVQAVFEDALDGLREAGATVIDAPIPNAGALGDPEYQVLLYEFKSDLNAYLGALGPGAPVGSLEDVIEFNAANRDRSMPYFGQEIMEMAQEKGPLTEPAYLEALEACRRLSRGEGIDAVMDAEGLDALVAPTGGPAWLTDLVNGDHYGGGSSTAAAVAGYPSVTVPMGAVFGLPVGISFIGRAWSESVLLRLAYAFEQSAGARTTPGFLSTADLST